MKKTLIFFLLALLAAPLWGQRTYGEATTDELRQRANNGDATAQSVLGTRYYDGDRAPQDYKQAVYWYTKAANQGNAEAQFYLGNCYDYGKGVAQDYRQAVQWYTKAANQGFAVAQFCLGDCYFAGNGVAQDYKQAIQWFSKAANQGYARAQYYLGKCYFLKEDYKQALYWSKEAKKNGYVDSRDVHLLDDLIRVCESMIKESSSHTTQTKTTPQSTTTTTASATKPQASAAELFAQADNYRYGRNGVVKNAQKAVELYTQAANMGDAEAQLSLGYCYYMGEGVSENCQKAYEWLKKAEAKKHTLSAARQQLLETTLANTAACAQPQKTTQSYTPTYSQPGSRKTRNKYGSWPWYYDGISHGIHFAYIQRAILGREAGSGASGHYDIFGNEGWSKGFQFGFHFNPMGKKEIIGMNTGFYMEFLFDRWKGAPSDYYDAYAEMNLHVPLEMVLYLPLKPWKSALHLRAGLGADFSCFGQLIAWDDSYSPNLDVTYGSDFINRFNLSLNLGISLHYDKWMFHATWQKGLLRHPYAPGYRCTLDKLSLGMSYLLD